MGPKLATAISLYLDGVRDGHLHAALEKYTGEHLVQHTAGIAHGRAGLAAAFEPLVERYDRRIVRPLRGFEDGSKVFLHTFQSYGYRSVERVAIDVFDTDDDDHLVEHWSVVTPLRSRSLSGYSQIDGPWCVDEDAVTEASKSLVRQFLDDVMVRGRIGRIRDYLCPFTFAQHSPDVPNGAAGLEHHLSTLAGAGTPLRYRFRGPLVGAGDFVAAFGRVTGAAGPRDVADLFRVAGGRIVEHWDAVTS